MKKGILVRLKTKKPISKANALWNVGSIVLITLFSIIIFRENIDKYQIIGLIFAFLSVIKLTIFV